MEGQPIAIEDREYQDKVQYIWTFGDKGVESRDAAKNLEHSEQRSGDIEGHPDLSIDGWIGTASNAGQLRDSDTNESINKIVIMVRGKLAQEDILEEFGEGGLYTKYIFGEVHANFLDVDDQEDIATTSRQRLIEEDPRYQALRAKLLLELKHIQSIWTEVEERTGPGQSACIPTNQGMVWTTRPRPQERSGAIIRSHQSTANRRPKPQEATLHERHPSV